MTKAIAPKEWPALPEGMTEWARSTKRAGCMYHAHFIGLTACGSVRLDRHQSKQAETLGDLQYWGVCPRCYKEVLPRIAAVEAGQGPNGRLSAYGGGAFITYLYPDDLPHLTNRWKFTRRALADARRFLGRSHD